MHENGDEHRQHDCRRRGRALEPPRPVQDCALDGDHDATDRGAAIEVVYMAWCGECGAADYEVVG